VSRSATDAIFLGTLGPWRNVRPVSHDEVSTRGEYGDGGNTGTDGTYPNFYRAQHVFHSETPNFCDICTLLSPAKRARLFPCADGSHSSSHLSRTSAAPNQGLAQVSRHSLGIGCPRLRGFRSLGISAACIKRFF
jgi:hypothetical protein